jgi:uroporphyrin-III C-methyltransferase
MNQIKKEIGKVIIAGAGPGDPELITIKAFRCLQLAEVIIADRLVSQVILNEYANKDALILHAGKQCLNDASTSQQVINELLLDYSLQGKFVVRLKGGDTSFFSNIYDELKVLVENKIPFEIIPGITAASGASAYAGIPLTARNYSTAVRFVTCYNNDLLNDQYIQELAKTNDTLVFYMSSHNINALVEKLIEYGIDSAKHIAVIEQATTPQQNIQASTLREYADSAKENSYLSPTLIIIGRVAGLYDQFRWLPNNKNSENYFSPLREKLKIAARA